MINTIIFDLGGVLVDWDPLYVYEQVFSSKKEAAWFVDNICNLEWNEEQDGGRTIKLAEELLIAEYPQWESEIKMYYGRWSEMLKGQIDGTVDIFRELRAKDLEIYGLTNWSAETFPEALRRFDFLHEFDGILVSGEEKLKKPDHRIYKLLLDRYDITANESLFIDDNLRNIKAAQELKINCIHFERPEQLRNRLLELQLI